VLIDSGIFDSYPPEKQASLLNSVATMGIAANALCKLPLGIFLDGLGPRYTAIIGAILLSGGSLVMALGDKQSQPLMMWGYFALGVAGPFLQMPCFQFSELYGAKKESARATLVLCLELSTGVFWVFWQLHSSFQLNHSVLFLGYSAVGVFSLVTGIIFWPDRPYKSAPPPAAAPQPLPVCKLSQKSLLLKPLQ
jgi:MFS family permease